MAIFSYRPDYSSSVALKPRVRKFQFGDGYVQRAADGINTSPETWTLTFKRLPSEIRLIEDFLLDKAGVSSFKWATPKGVILNFTCEEWSTTVDSIGWETLSATFVQQFDYIPPELSYLDGSWFLDGSRNLGYI